MDNNPIPTFIVREGGAMVHDVPKICVNGPGVNDHLILFPGPGL